MTGFCAKDCAEPKGDVMIQFGAGLIALQGLAEVLRCVVCLREGAWPARLHDVEELETQLLQQHAGKVEEPVAQGAAR